MTEKTAQTAQFEKSFGDTLRDSLMLVVTAAFVLLYAAAYAGKFDPLKDNTLLMHIEPVVFILIGYGFARLPARQHEQALKEEIARLIHKSDAAQYAKEKAQLESEALEEKIRNARAALKQIAKSPANGQMVPSEAVKLAAGILDS